MQSMCLQNANPKDYLNKERRVPAQGINSDKVKQEILAIFGVCCSSISIVSMARSFWVHPQARVHLELNFDPKTKPHEVEFIAKCLIDDKCDALARVPFSKDSKEVPHIRVDGTMEVVLATLLKFGKPKATPAVR